MLAKNCSITRYPFRSELHIAENKELIGAGTIKDIAQSAFRFIPSIDRKCGKGERVRKGQGPSIAGRRVALLGPGSFPAG